MSTTLKSAPLKTQSGVVQVTREQVLGAMEKFDLQFRSVEPDSGTLWAVLENGKRYPPKRILELAIGIPRNKFYGGKPSNDVFVALDFRIVEAEGAEKPPEQVKKEQALLDAPIPEVNQLVDALFAKTWVRLDDEPAKLPDSQYSGVYVLAYPDQRLLDHATADDLTGKPVSESDIFYVGVSHAGVRKRLRLFSDGLEDGGHHSGAKRFFHTVARGPYSTFAESKPFFVASISVPCTNVKSGRSAHDLRKLGVVAQLEWYVIARVKEATQKEPWLNKK